MTRAQDIPEFDTFVESARKACSVALADLLALGMPSPATSTGKLLTDVIRAAELLQAGAEAKARSGFVDTAVGRKRRILVAGANDRSSTVKPQPLTTDERQLAETTAQVIATADACGLPDTPDKLGVTPHAIRFLARAHLDLHARVEQIHRALDAVGRRRSLPEEAKLIEGRVDQIARVAIEGAIREIARQQGGIATGQIIDEAKSEGMLAAQPFISDYLSIMADAHKRAAAPALRVVPTPADVAKMPEADLIALYCRVMNDVAEVFVKYESYAVRHWDGMDGCWTDCTGDVGREEALRYWAGKTDGGTHHVAYAEIDYYRIFPGGTRMVWDGSEGREMHR